LVLTLVLSGAVSGLALAQGGSTKSSLSGVISDTDGGVIPGATVVVKNNDSGTSFTAVTNTSGAFSIPALDAGTYTVTVSLSGFKTVVIKDQIVRAASPASVKVTLEVGSLSETIEVKGGTEVVQTQSGTVSSTLDTDTLKNIPLPTRNALYATTLLPGVDTTGGPRASTVNGLPQYTVNITLDGVNVNNNMQKQTDGFYAMVRPQLDAIEEVTLTSATQGADSAGQGAVQIRFVTRSGTNRYAGTAYDYFRHPSLNTNYFFNRVNGLDRNRVILHQAGASQGGPIRIPGLFDGRGRAFFFFNYEEFYQPTEATRTATLLSPLAQQGIFQYNVTVNGVVESRQVNLLVLASRTQQTSTMDPTVAALLAEIRATTSAGNVTTNADLNTERFVFQNPGKGVEHLPTTRVDFNLSNRHRLSGTYYWQEINRFPDIQNGGDPNFPGLPNFANYLSHRTVGAVTLRSTLSPNMVNELIGGWQWSPNHFSANMSASQFVNQGGFALGMPLVTSATTGSTFENRNTPNWNVDNTLNWLRGKHSMSFGASFTQIIQLDENGSAVASANFGVQAGQDPADGMFNTTNFPGASSSGTGNDLSNARGLYALLTGRVTSINGTARLNDQNEYVYLGPTTDKLRFNEIGLYAQDSWRVRPTLTINGGVRWELQTPIVPLNGNYSIASLADLCGISGVGAGPQGRRCNLFQPGNLAGAGVVPQFVTYSPNAPGYETDWNNFAPNVNVAWRPNLQHGIGRLLLGDPEQATVRGGYSIAYNRNGMDEFQNIFGGNPGRSTSGNRNNTIGNLILPGESFPLLYRESSRLGPPAFCTSPTETGCIPRSPAFPAVATTANNMNIFDPNIQLTYSSSMSVGLQRSLSKDMAVEVRYVGTRNNNGWTTENYNEVNIFENGFLDEFKLAQENLRANIAAGRGNTFAFTGVPGTSPLPIYLANLNGVSRDLAGDPARYTGTSWTNTTFVGRLGVLQPAPNSAAGDLFSSAAFRTNMLNAGLPVNFWVANPSVAAANIRTSGTFTRYDALQIDLRRRFSRGLLANVNYVYAKTSGSNLDSLHFARYSLPTANLPHAIKFNTSYEIPVGRGRHFGSNMNPWLDGVVGNWQFSMAGRWQIRTLSASNVRLVGMTIDELQQEYFFRFDPATRAATMLPEDIILNTRRAFSTSATSATGYGALGVPEGRYIMPTAGAPGCVEVTFGLCGGQKLFLRAPSFARFDITLKKRFPFARTRSFDITVDVLNVFDNINFTPVFNPGSGATIFQTTSAYTDLNASFDPGGRLGQIIWRLNW
jgi:hypothetical protein